MSFKINWPEFSDDFIEMAKKQLNVALNSGEKPGNIPGEIMVTALRMGTKAPELEILEITELFPDRFKGIFKFLYNGDATLTLHTKVQANPLSTIHPFKNQTLNIKSRINLAAKPFLVPMDMSISNLQMKAIVVLVVDKEKGITLVFKNDPLERVLVSSTFDNVPNIRQLLQKQIEVQLRDMFQQELPQMIHNLSLLMLQKSKENEESNVDNREELHKDKGDLPHHRKWTGNGPISGFENDEDGNTNPSDGYYLYRSLSGQDLFSNGLGLRVIEEPKKPSKNGFISKILSQSSRTSAERRNPITYSYYPLGLPQKPPKAQMMVIDPAKHDEISNYIYRVQTFLKSTENFNNLDYFPNYGDDEHSMFSSKTAPDVSKSSKLIHSPPASFHKGQLPEGMHWQRPREASTTSRPHTTSMPPPISRPHSHNLSRNNSTDRVILSPSDNELTAHLANLMRAHLTISPNTQSMKGLMYSRASNNFRDYELETKSLPENRNQRLYPKKIAKRRIHRIEVPREIFNPRNIDGSLNSFND